MQPIIHLYQAFFTLSRQLFRDYRYPLSIMYGLNNLIEKWYLCFYDGSPGGHPPGFRAPLFSMVPSSRVISYQINDGPLSNSIMTRIDVRSTSGYIKSKTAARISPCTGLRVAGCGVQGGLRAGFVKITLTWGG